MAFKNKGSVNAVTARSRRQTGSQGDKKRATSEGGKYSRAASGEKGVREGVSCSYCKKTPNQDANHPNSKCWRDPSSPWWRPNFGKKVSAVAKETDKVEGSVNSLLLSPRRGVINSLAATPRPTPRLTGIISWSSSSVSCPLFPDTGSCVSLVHESTLATWRMEYIA